MHKKLLIKKLLKKIFYSFIRLFSCFLDLSLASQLIICYTLTEFENCLKNRLKELSE